MTYWRMQLHPDRPDHATKFAVESLAAGFIGLGFADDPGDLMEIEKSDLSGQEKDHWRFAHEMKEGDKVLIIVHHFPFAVAQVDGNYNYIREPVSDLGVWFRHFRAVDEVRYFADYSTNANDWNRLPMTDAITPLRNTDTASYQVIEELLSERESV